MSLTGPVLGNTLTLVLGSTPSIGMASIEAIADGNLFRIDSFFDIFCAAVARQRPAPQYNARPDPRRTGSRWHTGTLRCRPAGRGASRASWDARALPSTLNLPALQAR